MTPGQDPRASKTIQINQKSLTLEIASDTESVKQGLSDRESMPLDHGIAAPWSGAAYAASSLSSGGHAQDDTVYGVKATAHRAIHAAIHVPSICCACAARKSRGMLLANLCAAVSGSI